MPMILKILTWLIVSILAGVLYRMGGATGYNTKVRDSGVPTVTILLLWCLNGIHWNYWWAYLVSFGLMFGALTTYWKKKGTDATFINFWLHGFGIALSFTPCAIATGHYLGFGIRLLVLPLAIAWWSVKIGNAVVEEFGRGFLIAVTLPLLFV